MKKILIVCWIVIIVFGCTQSRLKFKKIDFINKNKNFLIAFKSEENRIHTNSKKTDESISINNEILFNTIELTDQQYQHVYIYNEYNEQKNKIINQKVIGLNEKNDLIYDTGKNSSFFHDQNKNLYEYSQEKIAQRLGMSSVTVLGIYQDLIIVKNNVGNDMTEILFKKIDQTDFLIISYSSVYQHLIKDNLLYITVLTDSYEQENSWYEVHTLFEINLDTRQINDLGVVAKGFWPCPMFYDFMSLALDDRVYFLFDKKVFVVENSKLTQLEIDLFNDGRFTSILYADNKNIFAIKTDDNSAKLFIWDKYFNLQKTVVLPDKPGYFIGSMFGNYTANHWINVVDSKLYLLMEYYSGEEQSYSNQEGSFYDIVREASVFVSYEYDLNSGEIITISDNIEIFELIYVVY